MLFPNRLAEMRPSSWFALCFCPTVAGPPSCSSMDPLKTPETPPLLLRNELQLQSILYGIL